MKRMVRLTLLLLVAACSREAPIARTGEAHKNKKNGDKFDEVADFKFLASTGAPLAKADLQGKVWLASFIFTRCPTHCVAIAGQMSKLQEEFEGDADFRIVNTTVDPAYDKPDVLAGFGKKWEAKPDRWILLYGERPAIQKFAYDLKIAGDPDEPLHHSVYCTLVDRAGVMRGWFDATDAKSMLELRTVLRRVLDEK